MDEMTKMHIGLTAGSLAAGSIVTALIMRRSATTPAGKNMTPMHIGLVVGGAVLGGVVATLWARPSAAASTTSGTPQIDPRMYAGGLQSGPGPNPAGAV